MYPPLTLISIFFLSPNNVSQYPTSLFSNFEQLVEAFVKLNYNQSLRHDLTTKLEDAGFASSEDLILFAKDFVQQNRPEIMSTLLIQDFGMKALDAHRIRVVLTEMCTDLINPSSLSEEATKGGNLDLRNDHKYDPSEPDVFDHASKTKNENNNPKRVVFKSTIVNEKAKRRKQQNASGRQSDDIPYNYGLPADMNQLYPILNQELENFYQFLTKPSATAQDSPIRPATADIYLRHSKLFLGWYIHRYKQSKNQELSIFGIIKSKERSSTTVIFDYIIWLRSSRGISPSYESNMIRGLTKLVKFRFEKESKSDPSYGEKSFEDIPLVREMRKYHREASKRQNIAPRSSNEAQKWLEWEEYLSVVNCLKNELFQIQGDIGADVKPTPSQEKMIATAFQRYLILAIFASVPDRQRTIRELEIGRTLIKDGDGCWAIKHGPDDYKTGKTYGDRPPLFLSTDLSSSIDDFIAKSRTSLCSSESGDFLFLQPRTGKPLTRDSVYQIVARACYKFTGKRTNPHLLRDMIVTHVRQSSDASEKELEALALFMGHSISMQRNSYDRRTLKQKVEPAIKLLNAVNKANDKR